MKHHVVGDHLFLSGLVLDSEPIRVEVSAVLPNSDFSGLAIVVHDWKGDDKQVFVSYSLDSRVNSTIHDCFFPVLIEEIKLTPPKGKGWSWKDGKWERYTRKGFETSEPS